MAKSNGKKAKADGKDRPDEAKPAKAAKSGKKANGGFDALAQLAQHPLISDLIAVGAMAAVAAIAEQNVAKKVGEDAVKGSRKAVKAAGKAAAAAIGQRLLKEVKDIGGTVAKKV